MQRLKDYFGFLAWQSGLGYIALWAIALWALDDGLVVFGQSGVCHVDRAAVLFYWTCAPASPLVMLAAIANAALTATIWAPVFIAAATVDPDAIIIALPIALVHAAGLPTAIFVFIRILLILFAQLRLAVGRLLHAARGLGAFSGKVGTAFPSENATTQEC
jgi:hypothetical protein